jgi:hypothetical protein
MKSLAIVLTPSASPLVQSNLERFTTAGTIAIPAVSASVSLAPSPKAIAYKVQIVRYSVVAASASSTIATARAMLAQTINHFLSLRSEIMPPGRAKIGQLSVKTALNAAT